MTVSEFEIVGRQCFPSDEMKATPSYRKLPWIDGEIDQTPSRPGFYTFEPLIRLSDAQSELTALKAELASEEKDHAELRDVVAALREELAMTQGLLDASNESNLGWRKKLTATEQRNAELERDKALIDWLIEQPVDTIYLDDGRIIDIAGRVDLRDAIDEARAKPTESGASE